MLKVLFDLSSAQPQGSVAVNGGGEYASKIFQEFIDRMTNLEIEVTFNNSNGENIYLKKLCEKFGIKVHSFNSLEEFSNIINGNSFDVLVLPICYPKYSKLTVNENIKVISVIHDLSSFSEFKLLSQKGRILNTSPLDYIRKLKFELKRKRLEQNSHKEHVELFSLSEKQLIFTVSYYTKYAMEYYLPEKKETSINVAYSPMKISGEFSRTEEEEVLKKFNVNKKGYFLLVSADRWAKNNIRAIRALDSLFQKKQFPGTLLDMKVIVLGVNAKTKTFLNNKIESQKNFILNEYVSSAELDILLKNAHLFMYPSLLEGFGYPPIEAMKYNTLSACSVSTSIPEICGDAVLYFNPYDIDSISISILQSFDEKYVESLKKRMLKHYKEITDKQNEDLDKFFELTSDFIIS